MPPKIDLLQRELADSDIYSIKKINSFPLSTADSLNIRYNPFLPYSMNIFSAISKSFSLETITDSSVKVKVLQILNALNESIINIPGIDNMERYLAKLHLVEQEDKSILIEWIYRNFRIGFVVCNPVEDSYYFFVSQNEDSFVSKSSKIGDNVMKLANEAVKYVIENT
jgi:hypothetical protein